MAAIPGELVAICTATGTMPVSCTCKECAGLCEKTPCQGTPSDILKLVLTGYGEFIEKVVYLGLNKGEYPIEMYQIKGFGYKNRCPFFENGLCKLHNLGLKPTEGRMVSCTNTPKEKMTPNIPVAGTWLASMNKVLIGEIERLLQPFPGSRSHMNMNEILKDDVKILRQREKQEKHPETL